MLQNKKSIFFNKNSISEKINNLRINMVCIKSNVPINSQRYNWNFIVKQYLDIFVALLITKYVSFKLK